MDDFDIFAMDGYDDGSGVDTIGVPDDFGILQGDGNSPPVQTDNTPQRSSSILDILGSIGSTARDLGTAVGKIEHDVKAAGPAYQEARNNAKTGNSLGTWWQYASTTDKMMVGIGIAGLLLVVFLKKD